MTPLFVRANWGTVANMPIFSKVPAESLPVIIRDLRVSVKHDFDPLCWAVIAVIKVVPST